MHARGVPDSICLAAHGVNGAEGRCCISLWEVGEHANTERFQGSVPPGKK